MPPVCKYENIIVYQPTNWIIFRWAFLDQNALELNIKFIMFTTQKCTVYLHYNKIYYVNKRNNKDTNITSKMSKTF